MYGKTFLLLVLSISLLSSSVVALDISPDGFETTVKSSSYITTDFTVSNPSNNSTNVSVDTNLDSVLSFSKTFITLGPDSSKQIKTIVLRDKAVDGKIWFNCSNSSLDSFVNISVISPHQTENVSINILPDKPQAGKNVVFSYKNYNSTGVVLCYETNNVYLLNMQNGLGIISLDEEDYGESYVKIGDNTRSFYIQSKYVGSLFINHPASVQVDSEMTFKVLSDGEPIQADVCFTTPNGEKINRTTSSDGILKYSPHETGGWSVEAKVFDETKNSTFTVNPKPISLILQENIRKGEETIFRTEPYAEVLVKQNEMTWNYKADEEGKVYFIPPFGGQYTVTASKDNQQSQTSFKAKIPTQIKITDSQGKTPSKITKGMTLMVQVTDMDGKPISDVEEIQISSNNYVFKNLELSGGSALWKVENQYYTYNFSFNPDSSLYLPSERDIDGQSSIPYEKEEQSFPWFFWIIPIIVAIAVILVFLDRKHIIDLSDISSIMPSIGKSKVPDDLL